MNRIENWSILVSPDGQRPRDPYEPPTTKKDLVGTIYDDNGKRLDDFSIPSSNVRVMTGENIYGKPFDNHVELLVSAKEQYVNISVVRPSLHDPRAGWAGGWLPFELGEPASDFASRFPDAKNRFLNDLLGSTGRAEEEIQKLPRSQAMRQEFKATGGGMGARAAKICRSLLKRIRSPRNSKPE